MDIVSQLGVGDDNIIIILYQTRFGWTSVIVIILLVEQFALNTKKTIMCRAVTDKDLTW